MTSIYSLSHLESVSAYLRGNCWLDSQDESCSVECHKSSVQSALCLVHKHNCREPIASVCPRTGAYGRRCLFGSSVYRCHCESLGLNRAHHQLCVHRSYYRSIPYYEVAVAGSLCNDKIEINLEDWIIHIPKRND